MSTDVTVAPVLYVVVPCFNEEEVLPITSAIFGDEVRSLAGAGKVSSASRVLFVDDGSSDSTWDIICDLAARDSMYCGISLSRNRGHQNALLAGLMEARETCDIAISIDCDGQDDVSAMGRMVDAYEEGCDVVYGVRADRSSDTFLKRTTAQGYYRLLAALGVEVVYNHADYRLLSKRVIDELARFREVNLYLRGMVPLVGFASTSVLYERRKRIAGHSHYSIRKMLALAMDGVTSLSIRPLRLVMAFGSTVSLLSFVGVVWAVIVSLLGRSVAGWTSLVSIVCFMGGIQLLAIGVIGEYVGRIYLEAKCRPRFIIGARTRDAEGEGATDARDERGPSGHAANGEGKEQAAAASRE